MHSDETGLCVNGKQHWSHVISTSGLTYYAMSKKGWRRAIDEIGFRSSYRGIVVHDFWSSYFKVAPSRSHSLSLLSPCSVRSAPTALTGFRCRFYDGNPPLAGYAPDAHINELEQNKRGARIFRDEKKSVITAPNKNLAQLKPDKMSTRRKYSCKIRRIF